MLITALIAFVLAAVFVKWANHSFDYGGFLNGRIQQTLSPILLIVALVCLICSLFAFYSAANNNLFDEPPIKSSSTKIEDFTKSTKDGFQCYTFRKDNEPVELKVDTNTLVVTDKSDKNLAGNHLNNIYIITTESPTKCTMEHYTVNEIWVWWWGFEREVTVTIFE